MIVYLLPVVMRLCIKAKKSVLGCIYHHTAGVELRFPNDFHGDFCR